jgi:hypothetical protein
MRGYFWDNRSGVHLLTIKGNIVYRAKDGEEVGTVEDGNVLGRDRQFVCSLVLLDSATASLTIPDALKTLMDTGA